MKRLRMKWFGSWVGKGALLGATFLAGCRKTEPSPAKISAAPEPLVAACASSLPPEIPRERDGFCVDRGTDIRHYGSGASVSLDAICTELFGEECELYRRLELATVTTFSFVEKEHPKHRIAVTRSRFESALGAYGFYQRRVVADENPRTLSLGKVDEVRGVYSHGTLYFPKGNSVFELSYSSEDDPVVIAEAQAQRPLRALARALYETTPERISKIPYLSILEGGDKFVPVFLAARVGEGEVLGRAHASRFIESRIDYEGRGYRILLVEARDRTSAKELLVQITRANLGEKWDRGRTLEYRYAREGSDPDDYVLGIEENYLFGLSAEGTEEDSRKISELATAVRESIRRRAR